jgi:glycosyltransferase involved in cell wall biosynthesis
MLFAGEGAVRKGVHFAVEAWLSSSAAQNGTFNIAGSFIPEYRQYVERLAQGDRSIVFLGHRQDIADLMRDADVFVLPTLEEGSPLVCAEAMACGCVNLVSDVCTGVCQHMQNALIHKAGDLSTLREHLADVYGDPELLARLRAGALKSSCRWTWAQASRVLAGAYQQAVRSYNVTRVDQPRKLVGASSTRMA